MNKEQNVPSKVEGEQLHQIRHSLSHIMAMAVLKKFPSAKLGIGPVIDNGFYYDFILPEKLSDTDLPEIEESMREIIKQNIDFTKSSATRDEALKKAHGKNQNFKEELINDLPADEEITFYASGDFEDLCAGPHIKNSKDIPLDGFKLTHLAGAYWHGDEKREMMTRIYGLAFANRKDLAVYLNMLEQAKLRDHRKLGKDLDLFTFSDLVGAGLPLWTPKGTVMRDELDNYVWELRKKYGYERVTIPHITKKELYETSGHWEKFAEELFKIKTREEHDFVMKPMNCPHHTQIYAHLPRSYRDLPQRYAETTMVYRDEQSGELSGLQRVRCITQDDAHVFCRVNQMRQEISNVIDIIQNFYGTFGFPLTRRLSLHDGANMKNYLGEEKMWEQMEDELRSLLKNNKLDFVEGLGEAAFYGPKIDFMAKDSIGREHQVATVQLDFNMPERFDLFCNNEQGVKERIVMIHCAIMGSIERFSSNLIEHLAGNFPVWLSPVQIKILTVASTHVDFAKKLQTEFLSEGIRVELDELDETVGNKIRKSSHEKIPYVLVIGDKEMGSEDLAVRVRGQKDLLNIDKQKFITKIKNQIKDRDLSL
jgi:threonyl-tRNA synthetase